MVKNRTDVRDGAKGVVALNKGEALLWLSGEFVLRCQSDFAGCAVIARKNVLAIL